MNSQNIEVMSEPKEKIQFELKLQKAVLTDIRQLVKGITMREELKFRKENIGTEAEGDATYAAMVEISGQVQCLHEEVFRLLMGVIDRKEAMRQSGAQVS